MARIRTIKPEFSTSEQIAECSRNARLLFVEMWCFCDDGGVHPASAKRLKMECFPADDDLSTADVQGMVAELIRAKLLVEFEAKGERFWFVTGWKKHQRIERPTFKYPSPPDPLQFDDNSANDRRGITEHSESPRPRIGIGIGMEGKGLNTLVPEDGGVEEDSGPDSAKSPASEHSDSDDLVAAWNALPDVPKVAKLTNNRRRALKARLSDKHFADNWRRGFEIISRSDFCRGRVPPTDGRKQAWRADLDWFLRPDSLVRLLEGKYGGLETIPASSPAVASFRQAEASGAKPAALLSITPDEATDPAAFDAWFERQTMFDHGDRTRADMHAVRCSVARLFRRPEVAATQLQARLENLAAGLPPTDPPRAEDIQQAARDLAGLQSEKGAA